jgi:N-acetylmuramoyl-L-alanine amidase-like
MNRRMFLRAIGISSSSLVLVRAAGYRGIADDAIGTDEELCMRKFRFSVDHDLAGKPIGVVMQSIGSSFEGTPYVANALEVPGEEKLVINLRGLDCVSLVENTLTISRCVKLKNTSFGEYRKQLQYVRYRGGIIDGYPSRLHYFTDWIYDNQQKQVLRDVSRELGGVRYEKKINFMTGHPSSYRQLAEKDFLERLRATEKELNERLRYFIPKEQIDAAGEGVEAGDIIAITTTVEGLDVSHTGIAARREGILHLLHAPIVGSDVQTTSSSLAEYLSNNAKHTGIMVARPLEPVANRGLRG